MNEEGKVLINDHAFLHPLSDNWEKALNNHKDLFLSPLQMEELEKKHYDPKYDVFKSDVFSLGMTLVTAGLLKSTLPAYDYSSCTVNRETVYLYLQSIRQKYSEDFTEFLSIMLDFNEDSRPTFTALETELRKFEGNLGKNPNQNLLNNNTLNNLSNIQNSNQYGSQDPQNNTSTIPNGSQYPAPLQNFTNQPTPSQNNQAIPPFNQSTQKPFNPHQINNPSQVNSIVNPITQSNQNSNFGMKSINMTSTRKRHQY